MQTLTSGASPAKESAVAASRVDLLDRVASLSEVGERAGIRAFVLARDLFVAALNEGLWIDPNVTHSDFGDVVFEFWKGDRKVTLYVGDEATESVKVWGPDMHRDMEEGSVVDLDGGLKLLRWLAEP